jgi:hypothetical protein
LLPEKGASASGGPRINRDARTPRPRLGDYVLVARLSEDALGSVYRAIHLGDERFMRLRLLESPELPRAAVLAAILNKDAPHRARSFHAPGRRETLGLAEGRPFLAWHETSGWTLDAVLAAARRSAMPVSVQDALRIVLGAAVALERAGANVVGGASSRHGLLWPGFVTISRNAEVWVRGFGLAPAVLPSIGKPRLSRLLAPYVAPEARGPGGEAADDDVYALGIILLELLTGRRPSIGSPLEFAPEDIFGNDVARLARASVAPRSQRLPSLGAMRERLQQLLADCPYEPPDASLPLYLEDLMTREKQAPGAPTSDSLRTWRPTTRQAPLHDSGAPHRGRVLRLAAAVSAVAMLAGIDLTTHRSESNGPSSVPLVALPSAEPPAQGLPAEGQLLAETISPPSPAAPVEVAGLRAQLQRQLSRFRQANALAEVWRLRAALSRVVAQRVDSPNLASQPYSAATVYEREGERLLARRRFASAREAFERSVELYLEAETLSHEERARLITLSAFDGKPIS